MPSGVNMDELVGNTDQFADSGYVKLLSDAVPGTDSGEQSEFCGSTAVSPFHFEGGPIAQRTNARSCRRYPKFHHQTRPCSSVAGKSLPDP